MSYIITQAELEHLTETELRALYQQILVDAVRLDRNLNDCPLLKITLQNILIALVRKQSFKYKIPRK